MQTITHNISRLDLHDSSFEEIIRQEDKMELIFNWAKFANLIEQNIEEPIIMGRIIMLLTGVHSDEFRFYSEENKYSVVPLPESFSENAISFNEVNDIDKTVSIKALFYVNEQDVYLEWGEWFFRFDTCEVSWTSYITYTEWSSGKLPND